MKEFLSGSLNPQSRILDPDPDLDAHFELQIEKKDIKISHMSHFLEIHGFILLLYILGSFRKIY